MIIDKNLLNDMGKLLNLFKNLMYKNTTINIYEGRDEGKILRNITIPLCSEFKKEIKAKFFVDNYGLDKKCQYNIKVEHIYGNKNYIFIKKRYNFNNNEINVIFVSVDRNQIYSMIDIYISFVKNYIIKVWY